MSSSSEDGSVVGVWFHSFKKTDREPRTSCSLLLKELASQGFFLKDLADSRQGSNKNRPSYLISNPAVTIGEMTVCYILDGILILYGIILTVLYCRLRMSSSDKEPPNPAEKKPAEGGIYAGLTSHSTDTYETIKMDKKPVV
ncbi:Fc receptor, IgE, high affinity I, gamma polypeptide like [Epinephelus moara]|uniref:Fc receptor, IgE, high affinity I, gamma polypeptide like n=1 Tax=Epinephelus moara TaxID=300413 RepID=UPI00214EB4D1|nr:Fc receptor, IgE, high affinity I, gamma polypeptide like [Epinephelus moara]